jgi:Rod binding domain-containing protein
MKIGPLHPASSFGLVAPPAAQQEETQQTRETAKTGQIDGKGPIDPEKLRLAREFEQIFIRKMLSSLEKSGRNAAGGSASSSGDAYGSMVVSALADAVSKGGGVGLAEMIARAASQPTAAGPLSHAPSPTAVEAAASAASTNNAGSADNVGAGATRIAVPNEVRFTVSPPAGATYPRPTPVTIINENHDIQKSFKDPNR